MKNSKSNKINIIFSSFLVIGYIVCVYFFSSLASQVSGVLGSLIQILMIVLFGLLLFYATRVGEGKQVKRFSLAVLLLIDLPSLYVILASLLPALPLHDAIAPQSAGDVGLPSILLTLACVALGYGIPYTFFSGYELKEEDDEPAEDKTVVEGGIAEELAEIDETIAGTADDAEKEAVEAVQEESETIGDAVEAEEAVKTAEEETAEIINETEEEA